MELVDRYGQQLSLERRQLISREEELRLQEINDSLLDYLQQVFERSPAASRVFTMLNTRLDFMWWMLDFIMESKEVGLQSDYALRLKKDTEFRRPISKKESNIAPLILGLYDAIDGYIQELSNVLQRGTQKGTFVYQGLSQKRFDDKAYVTNLDGLATSGVLPARILQWMVEKINIQATVLEHLKAVYRKTSSLDEWKHYQVNLDAAGCSFMTNDEYELFTKMDIYMDIQGEVIICRGKVVSQEELQNELLNFRVNIEFELLTEEQEQCITLFWQFHELQNCMNQVPTPYIAPLNA
jgi:hypothetical protein